MSENRDRKTRIGSPLAYAGLSFEIIVPVVLFMLAGYKLDGWLDSEPWFLLVGALLGIAVGFYILFRRVLPSGKGGGEDGK